MITFPESLVTLKAVSVGRTPLKERAGSNFPIGKRGEGKNSGIELVLTNIVPMISVNERHGATR